MLVLGLAACNDTEELFPPNATLAVGVVDSALTSQLGAVDSGDYQFAGWVVDAGTATTASSDFDYVLNPIPCGHAQAGPLPPNSSVILNCGQIGYAVPAGGSSFAAKTSVTISYMDVRRAETIDLPPDDDYDLDGVVNQTDNCPIVPNPDQSDSDGNGIGDACSTADGSDRDADGVPDFADNCLWVFNPLQTDAFEPLPGTSSLVRDGIGDICVEKAVVTIPGPITFDRGPEQLAPSASRAVVMQLDFGPAVSCDPQFTGCLLDPAAVTFSVVIP